MRNSSKSSARQKPNFKKSPMTKSAPPGRAPAPAGRAVPSGKRPPPLRTTQQNSGPTIPKSWRPIAGQHAIQEVLKVRPKSVQTAWLRQGWESSTDLRELEAQLKSLKIKVEVKPESHIAKVAASHQGCLLFSDKAPEFDISVLAAKEKSMVLFLDGIEDPHNLGAILRTAWLLGVDAIVVPTDRAVGLTATVHKVACGGVEHVPVFQASNFLQLMDDLKEHKYWVMGLSAEGKGTIYDLKIPEKIIWVIGAEDKGLRTNVERACDELIRIPQAAAAASYNASVSAAIALSETYRQLNA